MTQTIDPVKLKAAAEHLELVLKQYPDSEDVQSLLQSLTPMIEDAKAGRVLAPVGGMDIPGAWNFGGGRYIPYNDPSVGEAYTQFIIEMRGGQSEEDKELIAYLEAKRKEFERSQS